MALVAGCYAPTIQSGGACDTACPGDLVCIENVCREPGDVPGDAPDAVVDAVDGQVIDGPPGDGDADGLTDDVDNCPAIANVDQHDEDGDAIGDRCDPCPHLAGTTADADGDGVGDACDPQPAIAKQRFVLFDPFTSLRPEWDHSSGISLVGETLRATGASAFTRLDLPNGELRIATSGTIVSITAGTVHSVAIAFGINTAGDRFHYAEFYDSGGSGGKIAIMKADGDNYTGLAAQPYSGNLPTGAWAMTIDASVANQQIGLAAKLGGTSYAPLTGSTTTAPILTPGGEITVFTRNADVRYDYFVVIETLP